MKFISQGKTNYLFLAIIFVVALIFGSLAWWLSMSQENNQEVGLNNNSLVVDETADWQTYTNEEYGFEMKYPSKYKTVIDTYGWPNSVVHFIEASGAQAYRTTIEIWADENDFFRSNNYAGQQPNYITQIGDKYLSVHYFAENDELKSEWDNILSTFKLLDKGSADATDWQTYANEEYGFEIKYPDYFLQNTQNANPFELSGISFNFKLPNLQSLVTLDLSSDKYVGTGFQSAYFNVAVDTNLNDVSVCKNNLPTKIITNSNVKKLVDVNGENFYRYTLYDDAMGGKRGIGYVYFGVHNNKCFVSHGFLLSVDTRGFTDVNPVYLSDFDKNEILNSFEEMLSTFRFLD